jgi:hypothetical protein
MSQLMPNASMLRTFRILVILQLINLFICSPLYGVYLDLFAHGDTEIDVAGQQEVFLLHSAYVLILLALYVCTYAGLLWLKPWARALLPVAMAFSLVEPFLYRQEYPYNGIEDVLSVVSDFIDGALLAMAWASDVRFGFARAAVARSGASA